MWNLLHAWWQMLPKDKRTLTAADAAIRQARGEIDWLAVLPAQAAQAVLKTYIQAWKNCWEGRADEPNFKARLRAVMAVDIPQGRDLHVKRVHRRWGVVFYDDHAVNTRDTWSSQTWSGVPRAPWRSRGRELRRSLA